MKPKMKQTVTIENLTDLTSHWKHLPGNVVRLIDKSLSVGLYTVKATNVRVISRKTGRVVKKLRNSTPLNIKSIAALNYVIDEKAVENTLAGTYWKQFLNCRIIMVFTAKYPMVRR